MKKRIVSFLLALIMVLGMLPATAFASTSLRSLPNGSGIITNCNDISGSEITKHADLAKKLDTMFAGNIGLYTDQACTNLVNAALGTRSVPNNDVLQYWNGGYNSGTSCYAYACAFYGNLYDGAHPVHNVTSNHQLILYPSGKISYADFLRWGVRDDVPVFVLVGSHAIIVLTYDSDYLVYADGNGDAKGLIAVRKEPWAEIKGIVSTALIYTSDVSRIVQPTTAYYQDNYLSQCTPYPSHTKLTVNREDWIRAFPCSEGTANDNGYAVTEEEHRLKLAKVGETYTAIGLYKNTVPNYWYKVVWKENGVQREGYLWAGAVNPVGSEDLIWDSWTHDGVEAPGSERAGLHIVGKSDWLEGTVSGGYLKLTKITAGVKGQFNYTVETAGPYNMHGSTIDTNLPFNNLPIGQYEYYILVELLNFYHRSDPTKDPNIEHAQRSYNTDFLVVQAPCNHNLQKIDAVAATCTTGGNQRHWRCTICNTYFSDSSGQKVTTPEKMKTQALGHDYQKGFCPRCKGIDPDAVLSGVIGRLRWEIDHITGKLRIFGSGEMPNFGASAGGALVLAMAIVQESYETAPWLECSNLIKSIEIEEGITSIGDYAFVDCANLTEVTLPKGLTRIGNHAFKGCDLLRTVVIPDDVTEVGDMVFYDCDSIEKCTFGKSVASIGEQVFYGCDSLKEITLPSGIKSIGAQAFDKCYNLGDVYFDGVEKEWNAADIGESNDCLLRAEIHMGTCTHENEGTEFAYTANGDETHLQKTLCIRCGEVLSTITKACSDTGNDGACDLCGGKVPMIIASGNCGAEEGGSNLSWELWDNDYLYISGTGAMHNYESSGDVPWKTLWRYVKHIVVEEGVTTIGDRAFYNCSLLQDISLPSTLAAIGDYAFYGCDESLTSITIPNKVTTIGSDAFAYCEALEEIQLPKSLKTIGNYAFGNCLALKEITLRGNDLDVGKYVFPSCDNLTTITLEAGVISVDYRTVNFCNNLEEILVSDDNTAYSDIDGVLFTKDKSELVLYPRAKVASEYTIPSGVTVIGTYAFSKCSNLVYVEIPSGVSTIEYFAFQDCTALERISIPLSMSSIGLSAFDRCESLKDVYYDGTEKQWYSFPKAGNECLTNAEIHFKECDHSETETIIEATEQEAHIEKTVCTGCDKLMDSATIACTDTNKDLCCDICSDTVTCKHPETVSKTKPNAEKTHTTTYKCADCSETVAPPVTETCVGYLNDSVCDVCGEYRTDALASGFCGAEGDGTNLTWTLQSDGVLTLSGEGTMDDGSPWRTQRDKIKHIVIEDGVTSIGASAFYNCTNAESATFGNDIQIIGEGAFENCGLFGIIVLPESLTRIGHGAFFGCDSLSAIYFKGAAPKIPVGWYDYDPLPVFASFYYDPNTENWEYVYGGEEIPDELYWTYCHLLVEWNPETSPLGKSGYCGGESGGTNLSWSLTENGVLTISGQGKMADYTGNPPPWDDGDGWSDNNLVSKIVIEDGVTSIGNCAFNGCYIPKEFVLPDTLSDIGDSAFSFCYNLTGSLRIPENVRTIGDYAFADCTNLGKTLTIPNMTRSIGEKAFAGCAFEEVYFEGTAPIKVYANSFDSKTILRYQPQYTGWTDNDRYNDKKETWYGFKTEIWSDGTTDILAAGFCGADEDKGNIQWTLVTDGTLTVSGIGAMDDWDYSPWYSHRDDIQKIIVTEGITRIGSGAFADCNSIMGELPIPKSVKEIGDGAFSGWKGTIGSLVIPDGIERIEDFAFYGCSGVSGAFIIPASVNYIGAGAFSGYYNGYDINEVGSAIFKGSPPAFSTEGLPFSPEDVTFYFEEGTSGWTLPAWNGYATEYYTEENGHYYTGWNTGWKTLYEPECACDGLEERSCIACFHVERRDIISSGHEFKETVYKPTCTEQGYTKVWCSICNDGYSHDFVDALGHSYGDFEPLENEPTNGHQQVCSVCDETVADAHQYGDDDICDVCNYSLQEVHFKGDVNLDGEVNADDLTALARHVAKIELLIDIDALLCADVDGNGFLSADDLTKLARYVAKIISSL